MVLKKKFASLAGYDRAPKTFFILSPKGLFTNPSSTTSGLALFCIGAAPPTTIGAPYPPLVAKRSCFWTAIL